MRVREAVDGAFHELLSELADCEGSLADACHPAAPDSEQDPHSLESEREMAVAEQCRHKVQAMQRRWARIRGELLSSLPSETQDAGRESEYAQTSGMEPLKLHLSRDFGNE